MQLWRQPNFLKLWLGQAVSLLGSQVTSLAIALTAAIVLQATPAEMGLVGSLNVLPLVLFGLPAGLWVDRVPRRPIMIRTDIGRAILLASVPLTALTGQLGMPQLYLVSFGTGAMRHSSGSRTARSCHRLSDGRISLTGTPSWPWPKRLRGWPDQVWQADSCNC